MKNTYELKNRYNNIVVYGFYTRKAALHHLMKVYERINTDKTFPEYLDEWQLITKEQN